MEENPVLLLNNTRKDCDYDFTDNLDEGSENRFCSKLTIEEKVFLGYGPSKRVAKANAARKALKHPDVNPNYQQFRAMFKQQTKAKKSQTQNPPGAAVKKPQQPSNTSKNLKQQQQKQQQQKQQQQKQSSGKKNKLNNSSTQLRDMLLKQIQEHSTFVTINGRKVCRPYLNRSCVRGESCPYFHSEGFQPNPLLMPIPQQGSPLMPLPQQVSSYKPISQEKPLRDTFRWLQRCQNFSNHRCALTNCPYLHVSTQDEDEYCTTGRIPNSIFNQAISKAIADDMVPPGVTQLCKAYLNGECSWHSCPFRHISHQEFALEVIRLLGKHSNSLFGSSFRYRLLDHRISDGDRYGYGLQMPQDQSYHQLPYEDPQVLELDQYRRPVHERLGNSYMVSGMSGLMREPNVDANQREINKLRDELRMLSEENEKLRNSMQVMSLDENLSNKSNYHPNMVQRPHVIGENITANNYSKILKGMQSKKHTQQNEIGMKQSGKNVKNKQTTFKVPVKKSGQLIQSLTKATPGNKYFIPQHLKKSKKQKSPNQQNQTTKVNQQNQTTKANQHQSKNQPKPQVKSANQQDQNSADGNQQQHENLPKPERASSKGKGTQKSVHPVPNLVDVEGNETDHEKSLQGATKMESSEENSDVVIEGDVNSDRDEEEKCRYNENVEGDQNSIECERGEVDEQSGSERENESSEDVNSEEESEGEVENGCSGDEKVEQNEDEEENESSGNEKEVKDAASPKVREKPGDESGESEKWADAVDEGSST